MNWGLCLSKPPIFIKYGSNPRGPNTGYQLRNFDDFGFSLLSLVSRMFIMRLSIEIFT
jgi:hypothetical protein